MYYISYDFTSYLDEIKRLDKALLTGTFLYSPLDKIIVVLDNNIFIGFIQYLELDDFIEITNFAVKQEFQNKGIGSLLINELKKQNKTIFLEVLDKNNKAINFYLKHDFKAYHVRKNYYKVGDAILMRYR